MDESFLSQPLVIEASRDFICIRLTTYENQSEHEFMEQLYGRTNRPVENTTFTILSPDTRTIYVRPNRSPDFTYRHPDQMAAQMFQIAKKHGGSKNGNPSSLPTAANVKIGINIAASDKLPLIVVLGKDKVQQSDLESRLNSVAWRESIAGKFTFVSSRDRAELKPIDGVEKNFESGYLVVQPGSFGLDGKVIKRVDSNIELEALVDALTSSLGLYETPATVSHRAHIQNGVKAGVFWETNLPVTDRMEANARSRTKSMIERNKK